MQQDWGFTIRFTLRRSLKEGIKKYVVSYYVSQNTTLSFFSELDEIDQPVASSFRWSIVSNLGKIRYGVLHQTYLITSSPQNEIINFDSSSCLSGLWRVEVRKKAGGIILRRKWELKKDKKKKQRVYRTANWLPKTQAIAHVVNKPIPREWQR